MDRSLHEVALTLLLGAGLAHAEPLVVAGDKGIVELDDEGGVVRTISKRPARASRWSKDHARIFYLTSHELRAVTLDGTTDVMIGKLPRAVRVCATDGEPARRVRLDELAVQASDDFSVDERAACFSLKDRNENMVSVDLHVQVELTTGLVRSGLFTPECKGNASPCEPSVPRHEASTPPDAPFGLVDGHLVHDGKHVLAIGDFAASSYSASGRWALLHGNEQDGDYIHFDALLLDRLDGSLYAIGDGPGGHARALRKLSPHERLLVKKGKVPTADLVGETDVFWRGERLVFGQSLVLPDRGSLVDIPGDVVR